MTRAWGITCAYLGLPLHFQCPAHHMHAIPATQRANALIPDQAGKKSPSLFTLKQHHCAFMMMFRPTQELEQVSS